jgi:isoleucyl-tRNA synthetase
MVVKESSKLDGQYSLYAQLYKFTPEGEDLVKNGKVRYFSLQIQNKFEKFVDNTKKSFTMVIRALALTNMPVIKDMAPTLSENSNSLSNHSMATIEVLTAQLSEKDTILSEKDKMLSEKEAELQSLSEKLAKVEEEKRDIRLSEEVSKLFLSEDHTVGFKGGQKEKILAFVKTLSDDQSKEYIALHEEIITSVDTETHGDAGEGSDSGDNPEDIVDAKAKELSSKEGLSYKNAMLRVLSENPELAKSLNV